MIRLRTKREQAKAEPIAGPDDHGLHVADQACVRCGRHIAPTDEARRTAAGGCVHLNC